MLTTTLGPPPYIINKCIEKKKNEHYCYHVYFFGISAILKKKSYATDQVQIVHIGILDHTFHLKDTSSSNEYINQSSKGGLFRYIMTVTVSARNKIKSTKEQPVVKISLQHELYVQFIFPWPLSRECLQHEPGLIEYYNQLFCLCGHLWSVSEIQTSLNGSDLQ